METRFKGFEKVDVGTNEAVVYTAAESPATTVNLTQCALINKDASNFVEGTVYINRKSGAKVTIAPSVPVDPKRGYEFVENKPYVLNPGDTISVKASVAGKLDLIGSVMEQYEPVVAA
jgi:hypothetical protein